MIRISKIIAKDKLFDYVNDPMISRIDLPASLNRALKNPFVCKVLLYVKDTPECEKAPEGRMHGIFTMIKKYYKTTLIDGDDHYLRGIMSQKDLGFIKSSQIFKLSEIEKKNNIDLGVRKELFEIIEKYK